MLGRIPFREPGDLEACHPVLDDRTPLITPLNLASPVEFRTVVAVNPIVADLEEIVEYQQASERIRAPVPRLVNRHSDPIARPRAPFAPPTGRDWHPHRASSHDSILQQWPQRNFPREGYSYPQKQLTVRRHPLSQSSLSEQISLNDSAEIDGPSNPNTSISSDHQVVSPTPSIPAPRKRKARTTKSLPTPPTTNANTPVNHFPLFQLDPDHLPPPSSHDSEIFDFQALVNELPMSGPQSEVMDWGEMIEKVSEHPICDGRHADVWKGKFKSLPRCIHHPPEVAIKLIRAANCQNEKAKRKAIVYLKREISTWVLLKHENVLPFYGIASGHAALPALISRWMASGNINHYLVENPTADRNSLIHGVASGLAYLHNFTPRVIHGDVKGQNVLVNEHGVACIGDFGLSRMMSEETIWITSTSSAPGTLRWMSPELLSGEQSTVTAESDVYAFGITCWEIVTGKVPFDEYRLDPPVIFAVRDNQRPRRTEHLEFTEEIWALLCDCWAADPDSRPTMTDVHLRLGSAVPDSVVNLVMGVV